MKSMGGKTVKANEQKTRKAGISTVVALDFAASGIKAVKMRKTKDGPYIQGVDILRAALKEETQKKSASSQNKFSLPKSLRANHAALSVSGENAVINLVSVPSSRGSNNLNAVIQKQMALQGTYRISSVPAGSAKGKSNISYLAVALPEEDARDALEFVASGTPAPVSLEVSGLSAITALSHSVGSDFDSMCVGLIEAGSNSILLTIIDRGIVMLAKMFNFGGKRLERAVRKRLELGDDLSIGDIQNTFDISRILQDVMAPFFQQLSRAKDYVERKEAKRVSKFYLSGGLSRMDLWKDKIGATTGCDIEILNPFKGFEIAPNAYPDELTGEESRFSGAVGAGLNALGL